LRTESQARPKDFRQTLLIDFRNPAVKRSLLIRIRARWDQLGRRDRPVPRVQSVRPAQPERRAGMFYSKTPVRTRLPAHLQPRRNARLGDVSRRDDHYEQLLSDMQQHARTGAGAVHEVVSRHFERRLAALRTTSIRVKLMISVGGFEGNGHRSMSAVDAVDGSSTGT
jgi:hypothetical protein